MRRAVLFTFPVVLAACGGSTSNGSSAPSASPGGTAGSSTGGSSSGSSGTSGSAGATKGGAGGTSSAGKSGNGTGGASTGGSGGASTSGCGTTVTPGLHDETIQSGGLSRTFHVHVPPGYDGSKPTMLVFVFHGYTQHGAGQNDVFSIEWLSQMDPVADAQSFLVVYPDGVGNSWNAGKCCGTAVFSNVDDVGFFDDMLAHLYAEYCIDEKRVYAAGLSNGGFFSNRLGCERAGVVAAIGPVAGPLDIDMCSPSRPVPVFEVHGTSDPVVFYNGNSASGADAVPDAIAKWEGFDMCTDGMTAPTVYMNGAATCTEATACAGGAAVELCVIDKGGHQWPGGKNDYLGTFSTDLDTSSKMIDFFNAHPMP